MKTIPLALAFLLFSSFVSWGTPAKPTGLGFGPGPAPSGGPTIDGCPLFSPDYLYNVDVSTWPLDANSGNYINFILANNKHSWNGNSTAWSPVFKENYVDSTTPMIQVLPQKTYHPINFLTPMPANPLMETVDTHLVIVDKSNCDLYEFYKPSKNSGGQWTAYIGVEWDLNSPGTMISKPNTGSSVAAGTPLLPGIIRYDEVAAGEIKHAVDFMMNVDVVSGNRYVMPATSGDGCCDSPTGPDVPAYGMRLRLKNSFDVSKYGPQAQVILRAMKKYGIILTDLAGAIALRAEVSPGWNSADVGAINSLDIGNFEVPVTPPFQAASCVGTCGTQ